MQVGVGGREEYIFADFVSGVGESIRFLEFLNNFLWWSATLLLLVVISEETALIQPHVSEPMDCGGDRDHWKDILTAVILPKRLS